MMKNNSSIKFLYFQILSFIILLRPLFSQDLKILSTDPPIHAMNVPINSYISVQFSDEVDVSTLTTSTFLVRGEMTGAMQPVGDTIQYEPATRTATFVPVTNFHYGETMHVILTSGIESTEGGPLTHGYHFDFITDVQDNDNAAIFCNDVRYAVTDSDYLPEWICLADVENDDDLDVIITCGSRQSGLSTVIKILYNDGSGSFPASWETSYALDLREPSINDLNGDGFVDICVADVTSSSIRIFWNDGSGSFNATISFDACTTWPSNPVVGDFDGDGDLDISFIKVSNPPIYQAVFLNDGTGNFSFGCEFNVSSGQTQETLVADMDNDGDLDLLRHGYEGGGRSYLDLLLNDGSGASWFKSPIQIDNSEGTNHILTADFNNDRYLDIIVTKIVVDLPYDDKMLVLINNGAGNFNLYSDHIIPENNRSISCGDFDGDGDMDLAVVGNIGSRCFTIYLNDDSGNFSEDRQFISHGVGVCNSDGGDIDNDGDIDLVLCNGNSGEISIFLNSTRPATPFTIADRTVEAGFFSEEESGMSFSAFRDLNNDVFIDLYHPFYYYAAGDKIFRNDGTGIFSDATSIQGLPNIESRGAISADYNNDGYEDLLLILDSPNLGPNFGLYQNNGNLAFVDVFAHAFPGMSDVRSKTATWFDLDNDGDLEIFGSLHNNIWPSNMAPVVFKNNNDGTFTKILGTLGMTADIHSMATGDYDNDGYVDIFLAIQYYQFCSRKYSTLFKNNGNGSFTDVTSIAFEENAFNDYNGNLGDGVNCFFFDYENDGNLDLFVGNKGQSFLFHNNGNGTFNDLAGEAGIRGAFNRDQGSVTSGDFDNDGFLDIFIPNAGENPHVNGTKPRHALYINNGDGAFQNIAMDLGVDRFDPCYNVITGDIDNDGDLDLYLDGVYSNAINYHAVLWVNEGNTNHWLEVNTVGTISNRDGIGTRLTLTAGGMTQIREIGGGAGLPLKNDLRAHFGLGSSTIVDELQLRWSSGIVQTLTDIPADQILTITEDPGNTFVVGLPETSAPAATDVTIPLSVRSAVDILAANVTLKYNPSILNLNSISKTLFTNNFSLQTNTSTSGEITVGLAGASVLNGNGNLVNINFSIIGNAGAISYLDIVSATFNEGSAVPVVDDGRLSIQEGIGYDISGNVKYWMGDKVLPGVQLALSGGGSATATTSQTGTYQLLSIPPGNYTLTPTKDDGVNGISEFDAARVLQNVVGLYGYNSYQEISADVSGNGASTSFDASLLLQYSVGLLTLPFSGVGKIWDFIPTGYTYSPLASDMANQNFVGILYGDVSGNWAAPSQSMKADSPPPIAQSMKTVELPVRGEKQSPVPKVMTNGCTVSIPDTSVESNTHITLPLFINPGDGIVSFEATVAYDTAIITVTGVALTSLSDGFMLSYNLAPPGTLRVACACANEIVGSGAILELGFDVADKESGSSVLELTDVLINEGAIQPTLHNGSIQLGVVHMLYDFPQAGWYLISLPVIPPDSSLSVLFPTALNAYHWDAVGEVYNGVTQIEPKKGYWLAIPGTASEEICGSALTNYNVHFPNQDWYMIGSVLGSVDFTHPGDTPDGSVLVPAFGWDTESSTYFQSTTLDEKEAYWIAVMGACDLTVGGGTSGKASALAKADWTGFAKSHSSTPPAPPNINWETGELVQVPTEFRLSQNYPNPFNPETTIEYQLPKDGRVTLIIYNMMGQEVKRLLDEEKMAGYYQVVWDGTNKTGSHMGSGIYLIQIRAGGFSQTKKLLLVR